jgi:hypothetical protein
MGKFTCKLDNMFGWTSSKSEFVHYSLDNVGARSREVVSLAGSRGSRGDCAGWPPRARARSDHRTPPALQQVYSTPTTRTVVRRTVQRYSCTIVPG